MNSVLVKWCNAQLASRGLRVSEVAPADDLRDGVTLLNLLEVVTDTAVRTVCGRSFADAPVTLDQYTDNCDMVFEFLAAHSITWRDTVGVDLVTGSEAVLDDLLWTILSRLVLGGGGRDGDQQLLAWCQQQTRESPGVSVKDFDTSWVSGDAFLAIVSSLVPKAVDVAALQTASPADKMAAAFAAAHTHLQVPPILSPENVSTSSSSQRGVVAYLSLVVAAADHMRLQALLEEVAPASSADDGADGKADDEVGGDDSRVGPVTQVVLQKLNPEKPVPLTLAVSSDGMFLLERFQTPRESELSLLSHRLPKLVPLAGLDRVVCTLFWHYASAGAPDAARTLSVSKFRLFGTDSKVVTPPLSLSPIALLLPSPPASSSSAGAFAAGGSVSSVTPPLSDSESSGPRSPRAASMRMQTLEAEFLRSWRTHVNSGHWTLSIDAFSAALESVASRLYPASSKSDLAASVYRLAVHHLVPTVEDQGARLRRRIEEFSGQRRSNITSVTTNRHQLSALFTSFSTKPKPAAGPMTPHTPAGAPPPQAAMPASTPPPLPHPHVAAAGVQPALSSASPPNTAAAAARRVLGKLSPPPAKPRAGRVGKVFGNLTESLRSEKPRVSPASASAGAPFFQSPTSQNTSRSLSPTSAARAAENDRMQAARAAATASILATSTGGGGVMSPATASPASRGVLSPMASPVSALARVHRTSLSAHDEPPTLANVDRSVTHKTRPNIVSPLVPRRQVGRVSSLPQLLGRALGHRRVSAASLRGPRMTSPLPVRDRRMSAPSVPSAMAGPMSPLLRTKALLSHDHDDPDTMPATSLNELRRQRLANGPTRRPGSAAGSLTSPLPHMRSPLSRPTSLRDRRGGGGGGGGGGGDGDSSSVSSEDSHEGMGIAGRGRRFVASPTKSPAKGGTDWDMMLKVDTSRGTGAGSGSGGGGSGGGGGGGRGPAVAPPTGGVVNKHMSHLSVERVRRMSRGETGAPSTTNFSPTSGGRSPVSHHSPLSHHSNRSPASSRASSPDRERPVLSRSTTPEPTSAPGSTSGVSTAATTGQRAPPPVPRTALSPALRAVELAAPEARASPPLHPSSRHSLAGSRDRRPAGMMFVDVEDDSIPLMSVEAFEGMLHQLSIVPDHVSERALKLLLAPILPFARKAGPSLLLSFAQFESAILGLSRLVRGSSVRSLFRMINRAPVFQELVAQRGTALQRFET